MSRLLIGERPPEPFPGLPIDPVQRFEQESSHGSDGSRCWVFSLNDGLEKKHIFRFTQQIVSEAGMRNADDGEGPVTRGLALQIDDAVVD